MLVDRCFRLFLEQSVKLLNKILMKRVIGFSLLGHKLFFTIILRDFPGDRSHVRKIRWHQA